jgi:hypothetical protein
LRSSKLCVVIAFAGAPFPCCLSSAFFKLRWTTNFGRKKTTKVLFNAILFSLRRCLSSCPSLLLPIVFLDINQMSTPFLGVSQKKSTAVFILMSNSIWNQLHFYHGSKGLNWISVSLRYQSKISTQ